MRSHRYPSPLLAVPLAVCLTLTACGGDDDKTSGPVGSPTSSLTGPGVQPSENYSTGASFFEALASHDPAQLDAAEDLVAPGSAAAGYRAALVASWRAEDPGPAATLSEDGIGRYKICAADGACSRISAVLLVSGKVSSFKVDGKPATKASVTP